VTLGVQVLTSHGATVDTALLAASIGATCYSVGQARAPQAGFDLTFLVASRAEGAGQGRRGLPGAR
jgi:hypothetical protein